MCLGEDLLESNPWASLLGSVCLHGNLPLCWGNERIAIGIYVQVVRRCTCQCVLGPALKYLGWWLFVPVQAHLWCVPAGQRGVTLQGLSL